ncbi:MAG: hypothetical protein AAFU85_32270 [Planctomycetota bacterium]
MTHSTHQADSIPDDADPMIDALLAEFVPSPSERKTPPDLSSQILGELRRLDQAELARPPLATTLSDSDPTADSAETPPTLKEAESAEQLGDADPMIDALLAEFVPTDPRKRLTPPDLTPAILAELRRLENVEPVPPPRVAVANEPRPPIRLGWALALALGVAASVLALVWSSRPADETLNGTEMANVERDAIESRELSEQLAESPDVDDRPIADRPRSTPRELSLPPSGAIVTNDHGSQNDATNSPSRESSAPKSLQSVAENVAKLADQYWISLGVTPTPEAANHEVVSRLKSRLGVTVSAEALRDVNRLRRQLARGSDEVAARWLADASIRALGTVTENEGLVEAFSAGFDGQAAFDQTLVSMIDGTNDHSSQWYGMLSGSNAEMIAIRLADLSMDADLRCVRCHDSMIGGDLTQDNYWSFVALLKSSLRRDNAGWRIDTTKQASQVFFDLPDGRARMAEPRVDFLPETPTEFSEWTRSLVGSDELADGLVDSLWKLVYGRKLSASAFDADAAPVDPALRAIHDQLSTDLRQSGFDMARTLALIVSSPMTRRSVPESLRAENALTASNESRDNAMELVGAFAAATEAPLSSRAERVDLALRRIGKRFRDSDVLAQPSLIDKNRTRSLSEPKQDPRESFRHLLSIDFPRDDATLPVSWLRSIDDYDEQVRHLVYLSGRGTGGKWIDSTSKQLEEAGSRESALSRVWWILSE